MKSIKMIVLATTFTLASALSAAAVAADNHRVEAGSSIDTSVGQNHIEVSHAFDAENLTAGNLE